MTEQVQNFLNFHLDRGYRKLRKEVEYEKVQGDEYELVSLMLEQFLNAETPLIYQNDIFGFNRTVKNICGSGTSMSNFTPDYAWALDNGFDKIVEELNSKLNNPNELHKSFYHGALHTINLIFNFCERYRMEAKNKGVKELYDALSNIPHKSPKTYYEALVFMKIIIFVLRASHVDHLTLGRFDQYMYPYFKKSLDLGISEEKLLQQTELFFISINIDTDLYTGVQQGDNGQSLLLGGRTLDKEDAFNELSEIIMCASEELLIIDPKINLRVSKSTPLERYIRATRLTKKGLGFPQYCNDDIVISGLSKLGYSYEDAVNYTVAACWEFITPNGHDIPNIVTMNFPLAIRIATIKHLKESNSFDEFMSYSKMEVKNQFYALREKANTTVYDWFLLKNPFGSLFIKNCRENGLSNAEFGAKYNNFGIHGLGVGPAVDALVAIKKCVFEDKSVSAENLINALENNFDGYEFTRNLLKSCSKLGNNDDDVNEIANEILMYYANIVNGSPNSIGGIYRAGTGGPHDYIYESRGVGATADGRLAGEPYPSSFSPAIGAKTNGLLSVIKSFSYFDMTKLINGGPLTIEIHDNIYRNEDGIIKTAMMVKSYIDRGGHQLQINSISREKLIDAQKHPENYPNLVVRVWGWSGYFIELEKCFQNQIISRTEYSV